MALVETLPFEPWRDPKVVVDGEFRWRLGVRPLDLADWIEFGPDSDGPDGWIAQKPQVLADHRAQAFVALDDAEPECREVADAIVEHLATHAPERSRKMDPSLHPLDAAARLVPEDLALMVERDGQLVFGAGSVCFPNRWDLPSKLGCPMHDVHAPVARLNDQIGANVASFLDKLTPERSFWRLGWGILDVPDGYSPTRPGGAFRADVPIEESFMRVERETLRRFPRTQCVLFTIRTYIAAISSVLSDADSTGALSGALEAMPLDIREYKDLDHLSPGRIF